MPAWLTLQACCRSTTTKRSGKAAGEQGERRGEATSGRGSGIAAAQEGWRPFFLTQPEGMIACPARYVSRVWRIHSLGFTSPQSGSTSPDVNVPLGLKTSLLRYVFTGSAHDLPNPGARAHASREGLRMGQRARRAIAGSLIAVTAVHARGTTARRWRFFVSAMLAMNERHACIQQQPAPRHVHGGAWLSPSLFPAQSWAESWRLIGRW